MASYLRRITRNIERERDRARRRLEDATERAAREIGIVADRSSQEIENAIKAVGDRL